MSDTPIAYRTHERNQQMASDIRDSLSQSHPTPISHLSSHLTTLDHPSILSRLDQALPPLPDFGIERMTPSTNLQMEREKSQTSENHEDSPEASSFLRRYFEVKEREARVRQEAEEKRIWEIAKRPIPTYLPIPYNLS